MTRLEKFDRVLGELEEVVDRQRSGGGILLSDRDPAHERLRINLETFVENELPRLTPLQRVGLMEIVFFVATAETVEHQKGVDNSTRMMNLLTKVYNSIHPDPVYGRHMHARRRMLQDMLVKDEFYIDMHGEGWNRDIGARSIFLKQIMIEHNKAMGDGTLLFQVCKLSFGNISKKGEASYENNEIQFRNSLDEPNLSMKQMLRNLLHENTHAHQDQMSTASREYRLTAASPFYRRGKLYTEFFESSHAVSSRNGTANSFYIQPTVSRAAYRAHPIEREARVAERIIEVVEHRLNL